MSNDYKQMIHEKIKDRINEWIDQLKVEHPELLLTKQWQLIFPTGFLPGQNLIPVVTNTKNGKQHIADVLFVLPDSMELDLDTIELELKNEPYQPPKSSKQKPDSPNLSHSIDILNRIIEEVNHFIQSLSIPLQNPDPASLPFRSNNMTLPEKKPVPIKVMNSPTNSSTLSLEQIKKKILSSTDLPEWFKTIDSREIREQLLTVMAQSYLTYLEKDYHLSLEDFFFHYTNLLKQQNRLYPYCRYKAKAIQLDQNEYCLENYCSKKPYQEKCPYTTFKFGIPPDS